MVDVKSRGKGATIMYKRKKTGEDMYVEWRVMVGTEHRWKEGNQYASGVVRLTANPLGRVRQAANSWYRINKREIEVSPPQ